METFTHGKILLESATVLRWSDVHIGKDITSPRKQAVIEPPKPTAVALAVELMGNGWKLVAFRWDIQDVSSSHWLSFYKFIQVPKLSSEDEPNSGRQV